jgi:hypothetical protein
MIPAHVDLSRELFHRRFSRHRGGSRYNNRARLKRWRRRGLGLRGVTT